MLVTRVPYSQMEKEIKELTKQRDLAQSRVEDLLQMVRNDHKSTKVIFISELLKSLS